MPTTELLRPAECAIAAGLFTLECEVVARCDSPVSSRALREIANTERRNLPLLVLAHFHASMLCEIEGDQRRIDYLIEHALWVITEDQMFRVLQLHERAVNWRNAESYEFEGEQLPLIATCEQLRKFLNIK